MKEPTLKEANINTLNGVIAFIEKRRDFHYSAQRAGIETSNSHRYWVVYGREKEDDLILATLKLLKISLRIREK